MKKLLCVAIALCLILSLTGCGIVNSLKPQADDSLPSRMVSVIDIGVRPYDEALDRHYTNKDTLSPIIRMLRDMDTPEIPEYDPMTDEEQMAYTITATYADGSNEVYCILEHTYLRKGENDWHVVDPDKFNEFEQFILETPSDK